MYTVSLNTAVVVVFLLYMIIVMVIITSHVGVMRMIVLVATL